MKTIAEKLQTIDTYLNGTINTPLADEMLKGKPIGRFYWYIN